MEVFYPKEGGSVNLNVWFLRERVMSIKVKLSELCTLIKQMTKDSNITEVDVSVLCLCLSMCLVFTPGLFQSVGQINKSRRSGFCFVLFLHTVYTLRVMYNKITKKELYTLTYFCSFHYSFP